MNLIDLITYNLARLHSELEEAVSSLNHDQLHWVPKENCNHIAFNLWHYVRTEDNLVRFVLQDRRTTVWLEEGWDDTFKLDRVSQGTGMDTKDANDLTINSLQEFLKYMSAVWTSSKDYLGNVNALDLERKFLVRPMGERPASQVLIENILTHGFTHLGEIWILKRLQNLEGSTI